MVVRLAAMEGVVAQEGSLGTGQRHSLVLTRAWGARSELQDVARGLGFFAEWAVDDIAEGLDHLSSSVYLGDSLAYGRLLLSDALLKNILLLVHH